MHPKLSARVSISAPQLSDGAGFFEFTPFMAFRNLLIVLGDQLDPESRLFESFDPQLDCIFMAEAMEESTHVWSSKVRIAFFLSAMRHFAQALRDKGWPLYYAHLDDPDTEKTLEGELGKSVTVLRPERLRLTQPGDLRVLESLERAARAHGLPLDRVEDTHFFSTLAEFEEHARGRRQLRLEFWYRELRLRHDILMSAEGPEGGRWNYDHENRSAFGAGGPPPVAPPRAFAPDAMTRTVIDLVNQRFETHPGSLEDFDWPVTVEAAEQALDDFIQVRLPLFGRYQDAMWTHQPWLYHSRLAAVMNVKLLSARRIVAASEAAYRSGAAPLEAVEGFIRQILGWREYVRGVYWLLMPDYLERNALEARAPLPSFYWSGHTDLVCLREALHQTLSLGYAHHIQRLMVLGLHALLLGVHPKAIHAWFLAVYVDAVEWVELPNVLGMSQYADGGVMASKPYVASGKYIERMSNYCKGCRYDPGVAVGETACPFTTLYWAFLDRHRASLAKNPRMSMQLKNLSRLDEPRLTAIRLQAERYRSSVFQQDDQDLE